MTDFPPVHQIQARGLNTRHAPLSLAPYLDACDGALAVGGKIGLDGHQTHAIWALFRAGREVGRVTVEGTAQLRPVPPWWPMPPEAQAWIAMRARRDRAKAARRQIAIHSMLGGLAALAGLAVLVGLFMLGYYSAG